MKFSTAFLPLLCGTGISARSFLSSSNQNTLDEPEFKVPGDNPLYFCKDPAGYSLDVKDVTLSPNPPKPGEKLYITAKGDFTEEVDEEATVELQVKYNTYITLIHQTANLCENLEKINITCPIEKGEMAIKQDADIPSVVPPGKYDVFANVVTGDGEEIVCMKAEVFFRRGG